MVGQLPKALFSRQPRDPSGPEVLALRPDVENETVGEGQNSVAYWERPEAPSWSA